MKSRKLTACGFACAALVLASMSVFFVQVTAAKTEDDMPCDANISESVCDAVDTALDGADEQEDSESIVLVCPLAEHGAITGHFGENTNPIGVTTFNNGVNVAAKQGDDVYAAASGIVSKAEYDFEDGNYIVIEHMGGCEIYRHLDEILVAVGDEVESGEVIATVGSTGCATGPNLGFSVMVDGAYVSPESLFE